LLPLEHRSTKKRIFETHFLQIYGKTTGVVKAKISGDTGKKNFIYTSIGM
jgi:hypothetical protein